jgi:Xaa-Pro aminopeptidase
MRAMSARSALRAEGLLPFLVTNPVNVKYLTGFDGSYGSLVLTEDLIIFITDTRYDEYAHTLLGDTCKIVIQRESVYKTIGEICKKADIKKLFIEDGYITCLFKETLSNTIEDIDIIGGGDKIDMMRAVKDDEEISTLWKAAKITNDCVQFICDNVKTGMTEWDLAVAIENFYRTHGCRRSSFDTIVASGPESSMPHYIPSMDKKIMSGEPLMIDMGCLYSGYNSDLTRTFFMGSVSDEFATVYETVLEAQIKAVEAVRPGIRTGDLDAVARNHIADKGYGHLFGHSLGHGVGLEVHEQPTIKRDGEGILKSGMVITIEPGIYLPGKGGVRIEDMVLVTNDGGEILTSCAKDCTVI